MFDMNSSVITLGFNETVIYNQIYPSSETILSIFRVIDNTTVDRFTLTSGIVSQINSSVVRIRIDVSDLDIIKGLSIVNMTGGPPLLSLLAMFDLNLGILTLYFSETVNTSTLNLTTISLQTSVSSPDQIISVSGGIFLSEPASSLNVKLIEYDLNWLKFSNQLATNSQNTLSFNIRQYCQGY